MNANEAQREWQALSQEERSRRISEILKITQQEKRRREYLQEKEARKRKEWEEANQWGTFT